jgi:hypothetical protein
MNWWEQFLVTAVAGVLRGAVKNPGKFKAVEHVIVSIRDDAAEVCLAIDPLVAPPPGYKPA